MLTSLKSDFDKLDPGTAKWEAAAVNIERENAKLAALEGQLGAVKKLLKKFLLNPVLLVFYSAVANRLTLLVKNAKTR